MAHLGAGTRWAPVPEPTPQTASSSTPPAVQFRNIYSKDHDATWHVQKLAENTSEATITELNDGTLYRNDRPTTAAFDIAKRRWVARGSIDGAPPSPQTTSSSTL